MRKLSALLVFTLYSLINTSGQDNNYLVNGLIIDEESQTPLIGVTIQDSITGKGQVSDRNGEFTIELNQLPAFLIIRHLGYFEEIITIINRRQYKDYVEGNTILISLKQNPFLIDEVVVSDNRIAIKLFEEAPYDLIDYVVEEDRFIGYGYRNRNPLLRELFIGDFSGKILDTKALDGTREIYRDCQGEIYVLTKEGAYTIENISDVIRISHVCSSDFFYDKVKPIKSLSDKHFISLQKSNNGQYHDYYLGDTKDGQQGLLYRVGEWRKEAEADNIKRQYKNTELYKIQKGYIDPGEMRRLNSRLQKYLYSVFVDYPPVKSDMLQIADSVLLFDYNFKEILCFRTDGELKWSSKINADLNSDFQGKVHHDKISGRYFLEFLNVQLSYLIEINPLTGNKIRTIPILKYKHIDHINIYSNRIFFLHQPDFGHRGKKIYYLDI